MNRGSTARAHRTPPAGATAGVAQPVETDDLPAGERIRRLRLERGLSQSELGAGRLSKGFISQIESGRSRPSPESLRFIAQRLGVPLVALLPGLELSQQQAFLLRAAEAAVAAREPGEAAALLEEVRPLLMTSSAQACHHRLLAEVALLRDDVDRALDEGLTALNHATAADAVEEAVRAANVVGKAHHQAGRQPAALQYFDRAVEMAGHPATPPSLRALVNSNLGNVHMLLGDPARAIRCYDAAREAAEDAEDLWQLAIAHMGLGEAARQRGDLASAIAHAERSVTLFERIEVRGLQALILHNLGHAYADSGDSARARTFQEKALTSARALSDEHAAGLSLERLSALETEEGRPQEGLRLADDGAASARRLGDDGLLALCLVARAEACEALGDAAAADTAFEQARAAAERAHAMEMRQVLLREGAVRRARGDYQAAAERFESAARLSR